MLDTTFYQATQIELGKYVLGKVFNGSKIVRTNDEPKEKEYHFGGIKYIKGYPAIVNTLLAFLQDRFVS